jgi:hypothetical protein
MKSFSFLSFLFFFSAPSPRSRLCVLRLLFKRSAAFSPHRQVSRYVPCSQLLFSIVLFHTCCIALCAWCCVMLSSVVSCRLFFSADVGLHPSNGRVAPPVLPRKCFQSYTKTLPTEHTGINRQETRGLAQYLNMNQYHNSRVMFRVFCRPDNETTDTLSTAWSHSQQNGHSNKDNMRNCPLAARKRFNACTNKRLAQPQATTSPCVSPKRVCDPP